jgi:hypothetical protein
MYIKLIENSSLQTSLITETVLISVLEWKSCDCLNMHEFRCHITKKTLNFTPLIISDVLNHSRPGATVIFLINL